jgi:hypothetical protein
MWLWCSRCHRCYRTSEQRIVDSKAVCFYPDCTGLFQSAWKWSLLRYAFLWFPATPVYGQRYEGPGFSSGQREIGDRS